MELGLSWFYCVASFTVPTNVDENPNADVDYLQSDLCTYYKATVQCFIYVVDILCTFTLLTYVLHC